MQHSECPALVECQGRSPDSTSELQENHLSSLGPNQETAPDVGCSRDASFEASHDICSPQCKQSVILILLGETAALVPGL